MHSYGNGELRLFRLKFRGLTTETPKNICLMMVSCIANAGVLKLILSERQRARVSSLLFIKWKTIERGRYLLLCHNMICSHSIYIILRSGALCLFRSLSFFMPPLASPHRMVSTNSPLSTVIRRSRAGDFIPNLPSTLRRGKEGRARVVIISVFAETDNGAQMTPLPVVSERKRLRRSFISRMYSPKRGWFSIRIYVSRR